jgi:hypothetical protein
LYFRLNLGGGDPADLAINYGKAWAALGNLMPRLEQFLHIQKRDLQVNCDFEASNTTVSADVLLSITIARLLGIALVHGFGILKKFIKIINNRKGGIDTHE